MLILYTTEYCGFCRMVERKFDQLGLKEGEHFKILDASNPEIREKLIELGGKMQVPYLFDEETSKGMYESLDIMRYVEEHANRIKGKASS